MGVIFMDGYSANLLLSGCPVLEKLKFHNCCWDNVKAIFISGPRLKKLSIKEGYDNRLVDTDGCQFVISETKLEYFSYNGDFDHDYCFCNSSSVANAYIQPGMVAEELKYRAFKLLLGLSNANCLDVSPFFVQVLAASRELFAELPVFYNLIHLKTDWTIWYSGLGARGGLETIPPEFSLSSVPSIRRDDEGDDWTLDPVPACFLTHLKTIEISMFCGSEIELYAVKILLRSATVLEKMAISFDPWEFNGPEGSERQLEACERILSFPRESTSCVTETSCPPPE